MAKQSTQRANFSEVARLLQEVMSIDGISLDDYKNKGWFTVEDYSEEMRTPAVTSRRHLKKLVDVDKILVKKITYRDDISKARTINIYKVK